ncbi:MAG TPA: DUF927 domain-containing protein, partial [Anaerolineae bacterium]|nr:DUF927 domain-containing protein [Anaerolineae bacterium]
MGRPRRPDRYAEAALPRLAIGPGRAPRRKRRDAGRTVVARGRGAELAGPLVGGQSDASGSQWLRPLPAGDGRGLGFGAAPPPGPASSAGPHSDRPGQDAGGPGPGCRPGPSTSWPGARSRASGTTSFATACQLRDAGYAQAEALTMVLAGAARCAPPLPAREVEATVRSAYSRPPREPLADRKEPVTTPPPAEQPAATPQEEPKPSFDVFYTPDGAPILARWQTSRNGSHRYQAPIARFVPRVIAETKRHKADGELVRTFDLEVRTWRSRPVIRITPEVLADTRRFFAACMGAVGADARLIDPGAARYLPLAAMELAPQDRPRETVYEMTGWQQVQGKLCYLSPAGGVGAPEGIKVDLSNLEAGIGLSQDGLNAAGVADQGDAVFAAGIQALLSSVLASFPRSVMLPALGFTFLAPLMRWSPVPDRPALHFIGSTGTRKTALLGLLQAFYGCPRFLLSWQNTGNHPEIAMSQTHDMLVSVAQQHQEIEALCQRHGIVVAHLFGDQARIGSTTVGRDALEDLLSLSRRDPRPVEGIIFWSFARLARDQVDSQFIKAELRQRGYILYSMTDDI